MCPLSCFNLSLSVMVFRLGLDVQGLFLSHLDHTHAFLSHNLTVLPESLLHGVELQQELHLAGSSSQEYTVWRPYFSMTATWS